MLTKRILLVASSGLTECRFIEGSSTGTMCASADVPVLRLPPGVRKAIAPAMPANLHSRLDLPTVSQDRRRGCLQTCTQTNRINSALPFAIPCRRHLAVYNVLRHITKVHPSTRHGEARPSDLETVKVVVLDAPNAHRRHSHLKRHAPMQDARHPPGRLRHKPLTSFDS